MGQSTISMAIFDSFYVRVPVRLAGKSHQVGSMAITSHRPFTGTSELSQQLGANDGIALPAVSNQDNLVAQLHQKTGSRTFACTYDYLSSLAI